MSSLSGLHIAVTGGTGSFGRSFVEYLLAKPDRPALITVISRDEQKQHDMAIDLPPADVPIRYRLGDVRDADRMKELLQGADVVVHSAAMKHVPAAENNPMECVKTNIIGSHNVISAALANRVPRVVALSTDKAALPSTFYGASKLCLEKLFIEADRLNSTRFSVVRYANVFGSKGSVIPLFLRKRQEGVVPITHPGMTRFSITMQGAIDLVVFALDSGWGGEVIVPIAPSYRLPDVAHAVAPGAEQRVVGIRPGEKLHEVMVSSVDAPHTVRRGRFLVICPSSGRWDAERYALETSGTRMEADFEYSSGTNDHWLSIEEIRELLKTEKLHG
jgi:UDP-N-acetylglucosamine 4,6-dehydratase/5-epimerase